MGVVAVVTVTAVLAAQAGEVPAAAARRTPAKQPVADPGPSVHGVKALPFHFATTKDDPAKHTFTPTATVWPAAANTSITVTTPAPGATQGATTRGAGTPVWVRALAGAKGSYGGPAKVNVQMLDHAAALAAGVSGVLMSVNAGAVGSGAVRVGVDYRGFAQAYGGNFGQRLRMVRLPACVLSTPQVATCRKATPLGAVNDAAGQVVSAQVSLSSPPPTASRSTPASGAVVLAVTSDPGQEGGAAGSYAATALKPSGSWAAGSSTGSFTYSYPITVPPASSSLAPTVALSYDSGSVDGQTATTQAQSSWVGDGWSTPGSFVEQSFTSCADSPEGSASPVSIQDECYDGPVLTLSLNGSSSSLVWDSIQKVWKAQQDTGEVVTHVTDSGNGTGTYNTDYWTVTQRDGSVYQFGRNQLQGWASDKATTNSVDSMPVYSAHAGDPCYKAAGFTSSVCTMAYRWNLDYVKDTRGNAMAYYYKQDTNFYGQDNGAQNVPYVRDSHLDHVDYGFTDGNAYGTVPNKVLFTTGSRCVSGTCDPLSNATKANWPDVPYDLVCASATTCTSFAPSFFSTVRLTSIATQQYSTTSASYATVDSYALAETLPPSGDGLPSTLWLSAITHTGSDLTAGGSSVPITLPAVSFSGIDLQNRVDRVTDGLPALYRFRIATVTTESGSVISPTYSQPTPCTAPVALTPSSNTSSCYPVYWTPTGYAAPFLDWFNKYVVTKVTQTDPTGGAPATATSYRYLGGAAWHYDDNEVVKAKYRTYGQFRGYATVQTLTGDATNDPQTLSQTTYYRGMSRNNNSTALSVTDSAGGTHDDADQLAGSALETTAYLGNGGPIDHSTITSYWVSAATATRSRKGLAALTANWVAPTETYTRQAVTDGGTTTWRKSETDNTYDATITDANVGLLTHSYTHTVPVNAAYDRCASTTYLAANAGLNLVGLVGESETDSVACGGFSQGSPASVPASLNSLTAPAAVSRPAQVVSDSRSFYDDTSFSTTFPQTRTPTNGDPTMVQQASGYVSGAFTYQTTQRAAYDIYGRVITAYDANGNKTTTMYAVNAVGLTTGSTITNALTQTSSTTVDTQRGIGLTTTDVNGVVATTHCDALGRVTAVWLHSRATTTNADYQFVYTISNNAITAVTTNKLNDENGYQPSTLIYDALLRPRQTQTSTPQSGRLVTDNFYDTRGWKSATYNGWWDKATTPNITPVSPDSLHNPVPEVPSQDFYTYDGLGRTIVDTSEKNRVVVSSTTTIYSGDRTTVIPPTGGVTTATVTDPLGRTTELDDYNTAPTVTPPANTFTSVWSVTGGTTAATTFGYDGHGNQSSVTDAKNNTWTSTSNMLGQVTAKTDPDAGPSTLGYDSNGNLTQSTDSRGKTVSFTYDALNRKTGKYAAAVANQSSSNILSSWTYDNSNNAVTGMTNPIGHLTTSTAYWGGAAYTTQAQGFTALGKSTGETISIPPATEGTVLGKSYSFRHTSSNTTGLPYTDGFPAAGGLPAETVNYSYAGLLDQLDTIGGLAGYAQTTTYDSRGRVNQEMIGTAPNLALITNGYDSHTGRLTDQVVTRKVATPTNVDEQAYTYDLAGNITKQVSTRLGATTPTETQCYTYDTLDRLSSAWTATDSCAATPTTSDHSTVADSLGAASAYWTTWTHDVLGQRTNQTQHALPGAPETSTSYAYNTSQPHTLAGTASGAASTTYGYDTAGNTTTRVTPARGSQTLTWNDANQLTAITGNTNYIYNAEGNLLIQKDSGTTTLYLPGEQITLNTTAGTTTAVRYYPLPGGGTAIRTGSGTNYSFEITDQHGTPAVYLDNTAQTPTWRQFTPYGEPRGASTTAPDNRGFLNKPLNTTTGLTEIGARNYDPTLGRFISLDPVFNPADPQQLNGYTYSGDNPITRSDPTGLMAICSASAGAHAQCGGGYSPPSPGGCGNDTTCGYVPPSGCGNDTTCGHHLPGCGLSCKLQQPATKIKPNKDFLASHDYAGSPDFTYADAINFAAINSDNWNWVCENSLGGNYQTCQNDPFLPKRTLLQNLASIGLLLGAVGCGFAIVACATGLAEGVAFAASADVTVLSTEGAAGGLADAADAAMVRWLGGSANSDAAGLIAACLNSFDGNTPVAMADGTSKPISDVKIGDQVVATDPGLALTKTEPVTALHLNQDTDLADVTIQPAGGGITVIHTTQHHPFWDQTRHAWTDAAKLRPGDQLLTTNAQKTTVAAVRTFTRLHPMYNLTINHLHTYYVIAGNTPVLVHNCSPEAYDAADHALARFDAGEVDHHVTGIPLERGPMARYVDSVLNNTSGIIETRSLSGGRMAHWDPDKGAVVIENPSGPNTVLTPKEGRVYYDEHLQ
jgi:RHS repeat-associated protein